MRPRFRSRPARSAGPLAIVLLTAAVQLVLQGQTVRQPPAAGDAGHGFGPSVLANLRWRHIGPGLTSGRTVDFAVDEQNPFVIYAATATGGLWKTVNSGTIWTSVFERERTVSLGAVALAHSNPSVVWVGTGEANNYRSSSWGDGVYKSENGGRTWTHMGLEASRHVGRILVHPADPNTVYVAALGSLWGANDERGLFKTTDGGATWTKALFVSPNTGVVDVAMDPRDPNLLYAAAFQRERRNWSFVGGGSEGGVFKTTDGGKTWRKLGNGLPAGDVGRIALTVCRSQPDTVYAGVMAKGAENGIYRSDDRGASWVRTTGAISTAWSSGQIRCDPNDPQRLYVLLVRLHISEDGGRTFREDIARDDVHVDMRSMWIDPRNSDFLILGTDGGVYFSRDRGTHWEFHDHIPVTQFYTVAVDMQEPFYYVYGGTQDQNSFGGPSGTRKIDGITNEDWFKTIDGDGFHVQIDPMDPTVVYTEAHYGRLVRFDTRTGEQHLIQPQAPEGEQYRWNWSAPLQISPHDHRALYFAANKVFRSRNRGDVWEVLSPDLTRQLDQYALPLQGKVWPRDAIALHAGTSEYGNITTLHESALRAGLLAVGTDDGLIQVTQDGGQRWRRIERVPGVPEQTRVTRVLWSRFQAGTLYATFDGHKDDNYLPYVFKSTDYGATWAAITGNLPSFGSTYVITEGLRNPNLLFVGTEFGVFVSITGGKHWVSLKNNLPTVRVDDMVIHPREHDLVIGTHGRGFWILDDVAILEELTPERLREHVVLARVRPGLQFHRLDHGHRALGQRFFRAENPPEGAIVTFYLNLGADPVPGAPGARALYIDILHRDGRLLRRLRPPAETKSPGLHRVIWDLRYPVPEDLEGEQEPSFPYPPYRKLFGPFVLPGAYQVRLTAGETVHSQDILVKADPLAQISDADRRVWHDTLLALNEMRGTVKAVQATAEQIQKQLHAARAALATDGVTIESAFKQLEAAAETVEHILGEVRPQPGLFGGTMPARLSITDQVNVLYAYIEGSTAAPTADQERLTRRSRERLDEQVNELRHLVEQTLPAVHAQLDSLGVRWTPGRTIIMPTQIRRPTQPGVFR